MAPKSESSSGGHSGASGGVCGSDLRYWRHGGVGDFRLEEPMVLGHEVVGTVVSCGEGASGPPPGTPVAVHPATACGLCPECSDGRRDLNTAGSPPAVRPVRPAAAVTATGATGDARAPPTHG
jgi:L-idonate 5-dehydrogenase